MTFAPPGTTAPANPAIQELQAERDTALDALLARGRRTPMAAAAMAIAVLCVLLTGFHVFTASMGSTESYRTRTFVVSLTMIIGYLLYPTRRAGWSAPPNAWLILDLAVIAFVAVVQIYLLVQMQATQGMLIAGMTEFTPWQIGIGILYLIALMELTRRCAGWPMVLIALVFLLYVLFAAYAPRAIAAPNTTVVVLIRNLFYNVDGIFGVPVGAMTDYVIIFILFGQMMAAAGAGGFFTDLAMSLTGRQIGGAAKASVVASSMMGTISGSAVGNVVTTGSVTIPLMMRNGYSPAFAGAVESVASTGGQITPPVMGAVAFIMAQLMGVPYTAIVTAAIVPAALYYWSAFLAVHWEAKRLDLPVLDASVVPRLGAVMRHGWYYLAPVALLIGLLSSGGSLIQAAFLSTILSFAISFLNAETRITPARLLQVFEGAGRASVVIITVAAAAGVIISVVTTSGLSWRSLALLVDFAGDRLWLALILSALVALVLGMGVSTTAVYVTLAAILVPALIEMGLTPMAAHLFALYYAVIGLITPPVAMAAFAAAGISGAPPMSVAAVSARIALPIYLVPFIFAYDPALLLTGGIGYVALHVVTAFIGIFALSAAIAGQMLGRLSMVERLALVVAGVALLSTWNLGVVIGLVLGAAVTLLQRARRPRPTPAPLEGGGA